MTDAQLRAAIEENNRNFLLQLGRAGGGVEVATDKIVYTIGGAPIDYHNAVVAARFEPHEIETFVAETTRLMDDMGVPGSWHCTPDMLSDALRGSLNRHGFGLAATEPAMGCDIDDLLETVPVNDEVTIKCLENAHDFNRWVKTLALGFGEGPIEAQWAGAAFCKLGITANPSWRHYVAVLGAQDVGVVSLFLNSGAAGLYFVFSDPSVRGRGVGTALVRYALADARARGYRYGVLTASLDGEKLYQKLGWRTLSSVEIYQRPSRLPESIVQGDI